MLQAGGQVRLKSIFVCAFLLSFLGWAQSIAAGTYSYFDDFSTNKAEWDSQSHSPFVDNIPEIHLLGLLMFSDIPPGNRVLGLYRGFDFDPEAFIEYRFPVGAGLIGATNGRLQFDIGELAGYYGDMDVSVTYEPGSGGLGVTLTSPGHYEYSLTSTQPFGRIYVSFVGGTFYLDNLSLVCGSDTPVEDGTWGRIKSMLR